MHDTAERLEVAEAILHRSAEESPNSATTARLHELGNQVTAQAHDIDRRADKLAADLRGLSQAEPEDPRRAPTADGERAGTERSDRHDASRR